MNFLTFKSTFQGYPVFSNSEIEKYFPGFDAKNLVRWQAKGYLTKVRNNWYSFADRQWDERHLYWVANRIYAPSYLSLEAALSHYRLIPEGVFTLQSVTTRKTSAFQTPIGHFSYASVKPSWYFGYRMEKAGGLFFAIAEPAKALLDLLYLRPDLQAASQFEALRLNIPEVLQVLDLQLFQAYLDQLGSPALHTRARRLLAFLQQQPAHASAS